MGKMWFLIPASMILFFLFGVFPFAGYIVVKALCLLGFVKHCSFNYLEYFVIGLAISLITGGIQSSIKGNHYE